MAGVLYGVGVGPGDADLITMKAVKIIKQVDVIIVPKAVDKHSTALSIAKNYISEGTKVLELVFPMTYNPEKLSETLLQNKNIVSQLLDQNNKVAFLTLGDPMLYSTFIYLQRLLKDDYEIVVVPGITSFCAISSAAQYPLAEGNEPLCIIPGNANKKQLKKLLECCDNVVLMKVSRNYKQIIDQLNENQMLDRAVLVSRCGMDGEIITTDLEGLAEQNINYFSTIIAKGAKEKEEE